MSYNKSQVVVMGGRGSYLYTSKFAYVSIKKILEGSFSIDTTCLIIMHGSATKNVLEGS